MDYKKIKLNKEQLKAVETIDGPLLVIAGPGTGKTQLLSSRVAYILQNTDTQAQNILCLTFTNKAALNMRERLLKITNGKARDVNIKTFHSFASEIMNMYPDYFWNSARLSTAPDAVQLEIIQDILSNLPLDNPLALKFYGKFTVTGDVMQGLKLAKEAGLTPEKLKSLINSNLAFIDVIEPELIGILSNSLSYKKLPELKKKIDSITSQNVDNSMMPLISLSTKLRESLGQAMLLDEGTNKTTNTGKWKSKIIQTIDGQKAMFDERKRNDWWFRLAEVYEMYRNELHKRGYYDYSDMLVEVLTQIENHPDLRADIQERFLYVMIDEFQDTNSAQLRLAHLVAEHHTSEGRPNIMAVGDDDQSIFKFNGAELSNMLTFSRAYVDTKTVVLKENYRSTQKILDFSAKVMNQAEDRITKRHPELDKTLFSKSDAESGKIKHLIYETADEQINDIAYLIAKNYSKDKSHAVIARGHKSLISIASLLLELNIPVNYEQQRNILEHPIIEQVVLLAKISQAISKGDENSLNAYLSQSLPAEMWGIPAKTLWQLATDKSKLCWLDKLLDSNNDRLIGYGDFLLDLSKKVAANNINVSTEYILGLRAVNDDKNLKSPIHSHYVNSKNENMNEYLYGLSAIRTLRSLVNEYSSYRSANLFDFINFIILEQNNESIINDESPFVTGEHAVSLLTVHKAKGLEFDNVYIIDAVENIWSPKKGGRKPPMNLPLQPNLDDMDDYIRLMFTAITRARSNLVISSFTSDENGKETLPTPIVQSVLEGEKAKPKADLIEILEKTVSWPRLETKEEKLILKSRLENYSISVTHLINFLDVTCGGPNRFFERNLLYLPDVKTPALAYGTAMHSALETAQILVNKNTFSIDKIKDSYKNALLNENISGPDEKRYLDHGMKRLHKLFNDKFLDLRAGDLPEQKLLDIVSGNARLNGKIDSISVNDHQILVSDYKTDQKPLGSFYTKDEKKMIKAWRQKTQLIYYALLLENSARFDTKNKAIIGQMIYLEADNSKDFAKQYVPSREEIDRLNLLINSVWQKIMNLDFPDTSRYPKNYAGILDFENDLLKKP